jgi:hypothetical protein
MILVIASMGIDKDPARNTPHPEPEDERDDDEDGTRAREAEPSGAPHPGRALDRGAADLFLGNCF